MSHTIYLSFKYILPAIIFSLFVGDLNAQIAPSDTLPSSEYLNIYTSVSSEDIYIEFTQVPDKLFGEDLKLRINNESGVFSIPIIDGENYSIHLPGRSSPYRSDTIYLSVEMFEHIYHTIALIVFSGYMRNIAFGQGCYELDCTPVQDPYMPSVIVPFLIDPQATYKIPGRNKIISGKKALNRYTPCELEEFEQVFFQDK
jgi:hypothetical protein